MASNDAVTRSIADDFPLHWCVWNDDTGALLNELGKPNVDREAVDPHGRTPLMLAVTLGQVESTRVLLQHDCRVNRENPAGWTVTQEAIATGDRQLADLVLAERDKQRYSNRVTTLPLLLRKLTEAPDFYVEIKWEFSSWVPLVSRLCPHDTYKVYKKGSRVRIDTTLLGFDATSWQRGNRTYIFQGQDDRVLMTEIDHDQQLLYSEEFKVASDDVLSSAMGPNIGSFEARFTSPIVTAYLDMDKINFERSKSGIWGWRSDRTEEVSGRLCKVFSANNVELVTKTRSEHLTDEARELARDQTRHPLQSILGAAEVEERPATPPPPPPPPAEQLHNPEQLTAAEYFSRQSSDDRRDIGRRQNCSVKIQKLRATVWLCEEYPLSLQEQVIPIIDLMSIHSLHFSKLKEFIQMQLPSGFPVKIEIPLFHVLTARVTFGNIFALDAPVDHVRTVPDGDRTSCELDDSIFDSPPGYRDVGVGEMRHYGGADEDDELLQMAIQQSLVDSGFENEQVDIWEALRGGSSTPSGGGGVVVGNGRNMDGLSPIDLEDQLLQRAIGLSLASCAPGSTEAVEQPTSPVDEIQMALELSRREQEELQRQRSREEEMLRRAIEQSLSEQ